jgi:hypothetical protein
MKRPGDTRPERPGGRALQRLRQFEESRQPQSSGAAKRSGKKRSERGANSKRHTK